MDALFHFVVAIFSSYILLEHPKSNYNLKDLLFLSLIPFSLDGVTRLYQIIHHALNVGPHLSSDLSHNIFLGILLPLIIYLISQTKKTKIYSLIIMVLVIGHLLSDMIPLAEINGKYIFNEDGIPLFYPLSETLYLIPSPQFTIFNMPSSLFMSSASIAVSIYVGLIFLIIKLNIKREFLCKR